MLITHEREKLINAIIFFANHTKHLGKIKLFKLLYLLDFEHFRQTGQNVTGLDYRAWKFGPCRLIFTKNGMNRSRIWRMPFRFSQNKSLTMFGSVLYHMLNSTTATSPNANCAS